MIFRNLTTVFAVVFVSVFAAGASGCKKTSIISGASYQLEPNIETVRVMLNFNKGIKTDLGGSFAVKDYGTLEVDPWTPDSPFRVGFRMNTDIFNDQEYAEFEPVTTLPNGEPLPTMVNRPFARVKMKNEISSNYDIYTYVDVVGKEWVGVAMMLKFVNQKYFPANLVVSKNFLKDKQQRPRGVGSFFGPHLDNNGRISRAGGIAMFANIKSLLGETKRMGIDTKGGPYLFQGTMASYYRNYPRRQLHLQNAMVSLLETKGALH